MKIAFLTSCFEPGLDGVGDYTRSLASECIRLGHPCKIFALKDRYIQTDELPRREIDKKSGVSTCRYRNAFERSSLKHIYEDMVDWKPDWVSFQYVGYGFHPKGIVFGISDQLSTVINGRKLHIMLHDHKKPPVSLSGENSSINLRLSSA